MRFHSHTRLSVVIDLPLRMNMIHCELCCYSSSPGAPYSVQQEQADRIKEEQIERQTNAIITTEDVDQPVSNYNLIMHKYDNNSNGVDIRNVQYKM